MKSTHLMLLLLCVFPFACVQVLSQLPRASLKFPDHQDSVIIPFKRDREWIVLKVQVNDSKPLSFILDSGSPISILTDSDMSKDLNLKIIGNAKVKGDDGGPPKSVPLATQVHLKIGELEIANESMAVGAAASVLPGIDGIVGRAIFENAAVKIDWEKNQLILIPPEKFVYNAKGIAVPISTSSGGHFFTEVKVEHEGKQVSCNADIDIGNISSYFKINKDASETVFDSQNALNNIIIGWGANGPIWGDVSRLNLQIGPFWVKDVVTTFNSKPITNGTNANIGIQLLERFNPVFDFPKNKLYLEKRENFTDSFIFNQSGIILSPRSLKSSVEVAFIIPNSPSAKAGLSKGDKIIDINNKPVEQYTMDNIQEIISAKENKEFSLTIERNNEKLSKRVYPEKII